MLSSLFPLCHFSSHVNTFLFLHQLKVTPLQILALELPQGIWANFPRWFRTLPSHGYPSERIAQLALQHQAQMIFPQSPPSLLLPKFLTAKLASSPSPDMLTFVA
ncbi:MAG: hypothetical protein KA717_05220 [Woronichinia naegeliana WA131]|uniref:Uncharacterized protein n=1 Tax=Woronichinia naegeliana WA131 TaxID=2824559 RepID=A0A977PXG0_9CYAN|nr:MAG: hypothetical protein KA717_05220 [Woronichinia naegeliana WA131]